MSLRRPGGRWRLTIPTPPGWGYDASRPVRVDGHTVGWVLGVWQGWEAVLWDVADQRPDRSWSRSDRIKRRLLRDLRAELRRRLDEDGPWWTEDQEPTP